MGRGSRFRDGDSQSEGARSGPKQSQLGQTRPRRSERAQALAFRFTQRKVDGRIDVLSLPGTIPHFVIQSPRKQPAHTEHVDGGAEGAAAQAILASTEATRPMINRNFDEAITRRLDKRGNEAVHAFEWNERADALAPHRFERATGVAHAVFRETTPHEICHTTR